MTLDEQRHASLVHILKLVKLFEGMTVRPSNRKLAATLRVSPRTAYRYIVALRAAKWPVPPLDPKYASSSAIERQASRRGRATS